ncbi:uncharacterized protein LOC131659466 [Vicia villosa]|uniref:uncharacterized protein LOC131659466 n=1 Tax=Vicia villosa TaxID=3911 RepID=UPI00273BD50F|nr:uncharacterized protein LOC131659466 [Vicia villosa]
MYILSKKLQNLKIKLRAWNIGTFRNFSVNVKTAEAELDSIQVEIQDRGGNDVLKAREFKAQTNLAKALSIEEYFWKEKSKIKWHLEGDRNIAFFHCLTKIRGAFKPINMLMKGANRITNQALITEHVDLHLVESSIPCLVTDSMNGLLTILPSEADIKAVVFAFNRDSALGPDSFWDIIKADVIAAVQQFLNSGWILPGYYANAIILIPKKKNANSLDQFRPIALANFKFKTISKIIVDMLSPLIPHLISPEQHSFIHGRHVKDIIGLASEAINFLDSKSWCGSIILKVDTMEVFNILKWSFLLKVLYQIGFNSTFCNRIQSMLQSAFLSIYVNNFLKGYFNCTNGVCQDVPLPPLIFYLVKDVLSIHLSHLSLSRQLELIKAPNNVNVPSHSLYADGILLFSGGKLFNARNLANAFKEYSLVSGQGLPKALYFQSITDKIISKLASWKRRVGYPFCYSGLEEAWASILKHQILKNNWFHKSHLFSSLWTSAKSEYYNLTYNIVWLLGNGKDIRFWFDNWCGTHLFLEAPSSKVNEKLMVNHFMDHNNWNLSSCSVPDSIKVRILNTHIPFDIRPDKRMWKHDSSGVLSLKLAYSFKRSAAIFVDWHQFIWSKNIPPSKSFLSWRLLLQKLPTDEQLKFRDFSLPSKCNLCGTDNESDHHLFFECRHAATLWFWLLSMMQINSSITC